ncbi:MAG: autotransporter outer membrane beta-barrel domain-containing protein [Paracoccaceae bacterium]|nr:autotransporter outer membrane beta-barrel domain-containing protein [Paracoccaceae bacterium]
MNFKTVAAAAVAASFTCGSAGAQTQILNFNGSTTGGPTYNRATTETLEPGDFVALSTFGTAVPFSTVPFTVTAGGNVRLETVTGSNYDTTLFLYSSFNSGSPLANGIDADDDAGAGLLSLINTNLAPGNYVAVVTGFSNNSFGDFVLEVEIPQAIIVIPVASDGDAAIVAAEIASMVTAAQTRGLSQIVRANRAARISVIDGNTVSSSRANSTEQFSVWAEIGGGHLELDSGAGADVSNFYGQGGVEMALTDQIAIGVGVGGVRTTADLGGSDLDGDGFFAQPYIAYTDGPLTAVGSIALTRTNYDDSLGVIDDGNRVAGSLYLGYDVPIEDMVVATPFGYVAGGVEFFDTSAGNEEAEFITGQLGVELSREIELLNTGTLNTFASVAAEFVSNDSPQLGTPTLLTGFDDDRIGGRVELGFDFTIAGTDVQFYTSGNGAGIFTDAFSYGGNVGIKIPF